MNRQDVFVTGASGYIGSRLVPALLARGHRVAALVRPGREDVLPEGCRVVTGDALDAASFREKIGEAGTLVHLVGVSHPSPAKATAFREVDLASLRAALAAAAHAGVRHFIYLSVAQPAPVMRTYVAARAEGEALLRASGIAATILRPWYVLGPGHRWPLLFLPLYRLAETLPATQTGARRLGLVTLEQLLGALIASVESPAFGCRVIEVPAIRQATQVNS
jgi:uncharacterized protein YbjT (DUF2867 family)